MKKSKIILVLITLVLFFIPFFWFRPGETDLGGDSSRLYYYDPLGYLSGQSLYGIITSGVGGENVGYYAIPFILLIWLLKLFIPSTQAMIAVFHGLTLSVAFVSCYLIVKDLILLSSKKHKFIELAAILSGLFYIFTPTLTLGWDKAILTHFQFFLNPLMFFLIFRFLTRNEVKYLFFALIVTLIFPANFTFVAAPPFFAFYPFAILFVVLFVIFILRRPIPVKSVALGVILFLLLHLFHLGPQITNLFTGGSQINSNVFSAESMYSRGLSYFEGVAPSVKVSFSWLNIAQLHPLKPIYYLFIIFPIIIILGFILNKSKQLLLTGIFFLITFFFVTANITDVGFNIYKKLFDIPGFSMFRNFFGQWVFVFTFFYMLLFGQAIHVIFERLKIQYVSVISALIVSVLIINAWPLINGSLLNKVHFQSKNVPVPSEIDQEYENVLTYIKELEVDGKFISFPLSDPGYQMITGKQGGAYQGPSTISYLTGKNDFTGYDGLIPFNETFLTLVKNNDLDRIGRLFSILNIKYVFFNSDPAIYDDYFPKYPYTYVRQTMPGTQKEYEEFLAKLPIKKIKSFGKYYHIYEINDYLPHIYTTKDVIYASDALTPFFTLRTDDSLRTVVVTDVQPTEQDTKVVVEAKNNNPLNELINNYHLHVHEPFISRKPDDIFYPIVVRREISTLEKKQGAPNDYFDFSLLHLSKRILELEKYQNTPVLNREFEEPELWQIDKWKDYYSWESNLLRYEQQAIKLMDWINSAPVSSTTRNSMSIKLNETFSQHEIRIKSIIRDAKLDDLQKKYINAKSRKMFDSIFKKLKLPIVNSSEIPFILNIPQQTLGEYTPFIKFYKDNNSNASNFSLDIGGTKQQQSNRQLTDSLIPFNEILITKPETNLVLHYESKNLISSDSWIGSGIKESISDQTILQIDSQLGKNSGFSNKIFDYKPSEQYIITFDYFIEGDEVLFKVSEDQYENKKFLKATHLEKFLTSKKWVKHQAIFTSHPQSINAFIQFITEEDTYNGKLHLRNISVRAVPNLTMVFNKTNVPGNNVEPPKIQFRKINPTRYSVHVVNAAAPYTLVFSESFSNNWKLFSSNNSDINTKKTKTYFNNQIDELKHENTFFDISFLNNGTEVSATHTIGNGYANVWHIKPEDMGGKNEYSLDIVYKPQITFYYFLAISFITFGIVIVLLVFSLTKRK